MRQHTNNQEENIYLDYPLSWLVVGAIDFGGGFLMRQNQIKHS